MQLPGPLDLKLALESGELAPHFQPIIRINTGQIAGFEVLARWSSPTFGEISPISFIPLAEDSDLIEQLFEDIFSQACHAAAGLASHLYLSVNLSPQQFVNPDLAKIILHIAKENSFPLKSLLLEITESSIIPNFGLARDIIAELKTAGVRIALDDFGTGYSSLGYLQSLNFDKIKIDRSFVSTMRTQKHSRKIISAIISLGHSLGMNTIAEGVEDFETATILNHMGCNCIQGWFYGKAESVEQLPCMLQKEYPMVGQNQHPAQAHPDDPLLHYALSEQVQYLKAAFNSVPVGLSFLDQDLRFVSYNHALAKMFGTNAEERIGKSMKDTSPEIYSAYSAHIEKALRGEAIEGTQITVHSPAGVRHCIIAVRPVYDDGMDLVGISIASLDITEDIELRDSLQKLRDRYRATQELNPHVTWATDGDGKIIEIGSQWEKITGQPREQAMQDGWLLSVHPEDANQAMSIWMSSVHTGQPLDQEYRLQDQKGGWRWMRARGYPVRDEDGNICRWHGIVEDIQEQKKSLEERQGIVDELRNTPLNPWMLKVF